MNYQDFLASKTPVSIATGMEPYPVHKALFDFQKAAVEFCLRRGRAALFLDTGLGKTFCELEFAAQAGEATNGKSLILTPLAVARQIEREAVRFGYGAFVVRDASEVRQGINICNYDRLDKLDPAVFGCVVLDESSILKSFMGKTTRALIQAFSDTPFRLAATATPAPNDHIELGTHAEFLGVMAQSEMLVRWFINDSNDTGVWRLKGHAVKPFWDWCASWAVMAETPEDLGFDGSQFVLPLLKIVRHQAAPSVVPTDGLFGFNVSATAIHDLKRQTADARADAVALAVAAEPSKFWVIWCDTDYEADALMKVLPDAREVRGSHPTDRKEETLAAFANGEFGQIVTKPKIAGFGVNWQHADRMAFVGRSFSYEQWYQCVRREWRFGQKHPVHAHIVVAEGEDQIGRVIDRKADDHRAMKDAMRAATRRQFGDDTRTFVPYNPTHLGSLPSWL
jgi:superfamily II DNA or RNA helicase